MVHLIECSDDCTVHQMMTLSSSKVTLKSLLLCFKIVFKLICSMEGGATPHRDIGKALTGEDK